MYRWRCCCCKVWWDFYYPFNYKFTQKFFSETFFKSVQIWQNYGHEFAAPVFLAHPVYCTDNISLFSALLLLQRISEGQNNPKNCPFPWGDPGPHVTGPTRVHNPKAYRSVQLFCTAHVCVQRSHRQIDRQTDSHTHIDSNRPHRMLCIAMRPNNTNPNLNHLLA